MRHFILFQGYYFNTAITSALTEVWNPACTTIHLLIYPKTATQSCPFETLQDYLWDAALCCNTGYRQTACVLLDVISENNDNYLAMCICEVFQMLPYAPLHLYIFPSYFLLGGGGQTGWYSLEGAASQWYTFPWSDRLLLYQYELKKKTMKVLHLKCWPYGLQLLIS